MGFLKIAFAIGLAVVGTKCVKQALESKNSKELLTNAGLASLAGAGAYYSLKSGLKSENNRHQISQNERRLIS